jgi:hypothetical protein
MQTSGACTDRDCGLGGDVCASVTLPIWILVVHVADTALSLEDPGALQLDVWRLTRPRAKLASPRYTPWPPATTCLKATCRSSRRADRLHPSIGLSAGETHAVHAGVAHAAYHAGEGPVRFLIGGQPGTIANCLAQFDEMRSLPRLWASRVAIT